jgi:zinc transporter ZupT
MTEQEISANKEKNAKEKTFNVKTALLLILPLIALGGVILLFVTTGGGLQLVPPAPVEAITFERTVLSPGNIDLYLRNSSPDEVRIAQVIINDAVWPFEISENPVPRLGSTQVHLDYMWVEGEAYGLTLFSSNAIPFNVDIPEAFSTPQPQARTFLSFTLIGLYVGVIPIYLGLFWFPALRRLDRRWMTFLLAITVGLLIFLGLDTLTEAIEQAANIPGPFQGIGLIGIGALGTFFLLDAISRRQRAIGRSESEQRLALSYMIALGIGLHNLGEGLAIGAAFNVGEIALGTFLVIGFIIQNITEGLGIIAPILRDKPGIRNLLLLGLLGGAPAILGTWIGAFSPSPTLIVFFLAIGTGAVFEVVYETAKLIRKDTDRQPMPLTVFSGVMAGMLVMWVTGLLVK